MSSEQTTLSSHEDESMLMDQFNPVRTNAITSELKVEHRSDAEDGVKFFPERKKWIP